MKLSDFDYQYPEDLVAQRPPSTRDASKMMVINRGSHSFTHSSIINLPNQLVKGDLLVINDSKVLPVRLIGKRESGGKVEILLLDRRVGIWRTIATRKKRLKEGDTITFKNNITASIVEIGDDGLFIKFNCDDITKHLDQIGLPPLPPYIKRKTEGDYTLEDRERYQTIYAKNSGSAAAPTAGFHLTKVVLDKCRNKGVEILPITLHVGLDTFSPVRVQNIEDHKMHGEKYSISAETKKKINCAKAEGRRIIAVGTTTVRALESTEKETTNLFIYPGYKFKTVDAILTNFHQPKSTLLMMISAFAGREFILQMYDEAIKKRYRLFSYGDCMLIL